jgi:cobalt-precorrin 5A hydrolase/precorrin-3B C17-methyltransferase
MVSKSTPVFVVLNQTGLETARRVAAVLPGAEVHGLMGRVDGADAVFTGAVGHLRALFRGHRPIIALCATGIVVRALAPLLIDKRGEPPVLALAADGSCVIPLLGGHMGANVMAQRIAGALGIAPSLTTAGDLTAGVALDAVPDGWRIENLPAARKAMAALIDDQPVGLDSEVDEGLIGWLLGEGAPFVRLRPGACAEAESGREHHGPVVRVSDRRDAATAGCSADGDPPLVLRPPTLALGVGCARGCAPGELENLVRETLTHHGLAPGSVACVVSIDVKADEPAVLALGESLDVPVRFLDAKTLERETPRLANPSDVVFAEVGCHGVAEAAALAAAGPNGTLIAPKRKSLQATCALARTPAGIAADTVGHPRGCLHVVGIGPGADVWRTPEVSAAIANATDLVGYRLYLDLLGDAQLGKARHVSDLGAESERAALALNLAARGRRVALVCSGDPGIYALATLVFELMERENRDDWRRVAVTVCPGLSAMQAAAARAGAPLGHDFCAVSLSDLLTPRTMIERRLAAAAEGDFVVALYNPVSRRRRDLFAHAREVLLRHRPAETPVIIARNLGREAESVSVTTLEALDIEAVDMLTIVLVGASTTRQWGGRVYTPRGYAAKRREAATDATQSGSTP